MSLLLRVSNFKRHIDLFILFLQIKIPAEANIYEELGSEFFFS